MAFVLATEMFLKLEGHETLSARTVAEAEVLLERLRRRGRGDRRLSSGRKEHGPRSAAAAARARGLRRSGSHLERRPAVRSAIDQVPGRRVPLPQQAREHHGARRCDRRAQHDVAELEPRGCLGDRTPGLRGTVTRISPYLLPGSGWTLWSMGDFNRTAHIAIAAVALLCGATASCFTEARRSARACGTSARRQCVARGRAVPAELRAVSRSRSHRRCA